MKKWIVFFSLLTALLVVPAGVQAQVLQESVKNDEVVQRETLEKEINDLKEIYRGQLSDYRDAEKAFTIARDQYHQLQTLASINDATEASRKVFILRDEVLMTYFQLLRTSIIAADGIEVSLKEVVVKRLEMQVIWLIDHKKRVEQMQDRSQFNSLADEIIEKADVFTEISLQSTSILALGKLQDVYDRLVVVRKDISEVEAKSSTADRSRASKETDKMINAVKGTIETTWVNLGEDVRDDNVTSFSSNLVKTLEPIYSGLNKTVSFLQELLREL